MTSVRSYEAFSYRDNELGLRVHRDGLLSAREQEIADLPRPLSDVYVRRVSRIAGGVAASAGMAAIALGALLDDGAHEALGAAIVHAPLTLMLIATVVAVPLVMAAARPFARRRLAALLREDLHATRDVHADVARLERRPSELVIARANELETRSVAWMLVGWALATPLALHLAVYFLGCSAAGGGGFELGGFDHWIELSLVLTGVAHLTLATLGVRFAKALRQTIEPTTWQTPSTWAPLGWTLLAGCVPGVFLLGVPPILVLITGVVFIPAVFAAAKRRVFFERSILEQLAHVRVEPDAHVAPLPKAEFEVPPEAGANNAERPSPGEGAREFEERARAMV